MSLTPPCGIQCSLVRAWDGTASIRSLPAGCAVAALPASPSLQRRVSSASPADVPIARRPPPRGQTQHAGHARASLVSGSIAVACGLTQASRRRRCAWKPTVRGNSSSSTAPAPTAETPTRQLDDSDAATAAVPVDLVETLPDTLGEVVAHILRALRERQRQEHDAVHDHELPVRIPKPVWSRLGGLVKRCEEYPSQLRDDQWISLRLDGCSWGTMINRLNSSGVLTQGFNDGIAEAMQACCRAIMIEFGGVLGYTHSDELTVLVPPSKQASGGARGLLDGSVHEWASIAASVAAGEFNQRLDKLAAERNLQLEDVIVAHFDCRVGAYDTAEEALGLVLWRANDCHVNSASDAIKFSDAPFRVRQFNTIQKLCYLQERDMLPLRRHQAYGTLLADVSGSDGQHSLVVVNAGLGGLPQHVFNIAQLGSFLPGTTGESVLAELPDPLPEEVAWPVTAPLCTTAAEM